MSDPLNTPVAIPMGESGLLYTPADRAEIIQNMDTTPEGTLRSIRGPAAWVPDRGQGYPTLGEPYGIFHCRLRGGMIDMLLLRAGSVLYRYTGWTRGWTSIATGLTDERRARYPDQFVVVGDQVVWTNGLDRARLINYDGQVIPLGFDGPPSAPDVKAASSHPTDDMHGRHPNMDHYSWWGQLGDVSSLESAQSGWLEPGIWQWRAQLEDDFGNRSPISPYSPSAEVTGMYFSPLPDARWHRRLVTSGAVAIDTEVERSDYSGTTPDDVTRSAQVRMERSNYDHAVAVIMYRTMNERRHGNEVRLLTRQGGRGPFVLPDGKPDAHLGPPAVEIAAMPVFKVMCVHDGALVIANFEGDPGGMRKSQPRFPGTMPALQYMQPAAGGEEITAVFSHGGTLFAATERSIMAIPEFGAPAVTISQGVGVAAPRSIQALPDGSLIWLSLDGFYAMAADSNVPVPVSLPNHRQIQDELALSRIRMVTSTFDRVRRAYICSVPPAGGTRNRMQLVFDQHGWRRYVMGLSLADLTSLQDWRGYVLGCGRAANVNQVLALHREGQDWTPPSRTARFRSAWMAVDPTASIPFRVRTLYLRFVDGSYGNVTVRFFRNGSYTAVHEDTTVLSLGPDTSREPLSPTPRNPTNDRADVAVIGTSHVHARRAFWRQVQTAGLEDVTLWAFEVEAEYPIELHLAAFSYDWSTVGDGNVRQRFPRGADV